MRESKVTCNMCGREIYMWDEDNGFSIDTRFGYGSKRDGEKIQLDLCCNCMDKVADYVIQKCKINPIAEEWEGDL